MEIYLNRIDGFDDAIISMFLSKRTLTRELECAIRREVNMCSNSVFFDDSPIGALVAMTEQLEDWLKKLFKW